MILHKNGPLTCIFCINSKIFVYLKLYKYKSNAFEKELCYKNIYRLLYNPEQNVRN